MAGDQYLDLARENFVGNIATILCTGFITKEKEINKIIDILKEYDLPDVIMALAIGIRNFSEALAEEIREDKELMEMYEEILDEIESHEKNNLILGLITDIVNMAIKHVDSDEEKLNWPKPNVNFERILEMKERFSALTDDITVVILAMLKYICLNNKYKMPDQLIAAMYEAVGQAVKELR